ncbi:MAG: TRAP transporter substrate-binding protein DctP [Magnetospirillum sp.]
MKALKAATIAALSALALVGQGVTTSSRAADLRLGDFQSTTHIVSQEGTGRWMKRVEELTGGTIHFSHFPAEQAAKAAGLLDAVKGGILDAALIGPLYHSETLPLNSVIGLPGFYTSAEQGTAALQAMLKSGPLRDELTAAGVVPIFSFVLPPYQVLSKSQRLGAPDDWRGINLRTSGSTQAMIARSLGAAGISMPGPEVYTAVERGRLNAILFPLASVPGYNLQEVVKHISVNGAFGGYSFVLVLRKETYDNLDAKTKQAMAQAGDEIAAHVAKAQDDSVAKLTEEWKAKGINVYSFTDAERTALTKAVSDVRADWLKRVGERNPAAGDALKQYDMLIGN